MDFETIAHSKCGNYEIRMYEDGELQCVKVYKNGFMQLGWIPSGRVAWTHTQSINQNTLVNLKEWLHGSDCTVSVRDEKSNEVNDS